jgi:hypothetical protein
MADKDQPISQLQLVTDWLTYVISNEQELLDALTKSKRKILYNSFEKAIASRDPDNVISVALRYKYYLRYLDMGVGRGVPIGSRASNKEKFDRYRTRNGQVRVYKRKKIPVYNKPITAQTKKLVELLSKNFGIKAVTSIEIVSNNLEQVEIKL